VDFLTTWARIRFSKLSFMEPVIAFCPLMYMATVWMDISAYTAPNKEFRHLSSHVSNNIMYAYTSIFSIELRRLLHHFMDILNATWAAADVAEDIQNRYFLMWHRLRLYKSTLVNCYNFRTLCRCVVICYTWSRSWYSSFQTPCFLSKLHSRRREDDFKFGECFQSFSSQYFV
jgi:hypothetical protein